MKNITLQLSDEERKLMMTSGLSQKEAQMRIDLRKDKTYLERSFLNILFGTKDPYRREGYVSGAESYYSRGYMEGRESTNMLNPIDKSTLANAVNNLMGSIGINLSYHTSFGGLFMNRIKNTVGQTKFVEYENDFNCGLTKNEIILDEEIIKILNQAQKKIENLIQNINK